MRRDTCVPDTANSVWNFMRYTQYYIKHDNHSMASSTIALSPHGMDCLDLHIGVSIDSYTKEKK
jgi:hypothetical protein